MNGERRNDEFKDGSSFIATAAFLANDAGGGTRTRTPFGKGS
jgi:hypothetical protein